MSSKGSGALPAPVSVPRIEEYVLNDRSQLLYTCKWQAPQTHALLVFLHGYNAYIGRGYDWIASFAAAAGITCAALDQISFGRSQTVQHSSEEEATALKQEPASADASGSSGSCACGRRRARTNVRAFVPTFQHLVDDALLVAARLQSQYPGVPLFFHGESMGGAVALHAALSGSSAVRIAGVVLFAPMCYLSPTLQPHPVVQFVGQAAAWLFPAAPIAPVKDILDFTFHDPEKAAEVRRDTMRHQGKLRLGTAFAFRDAMSSLQARFGELTTPFVVFHGGADRVTSTEGSKALLRESVRCTDKTAVWLDGAWHALWSEPLDTRQRLIEDITAWILHRVDAKHPDLQCSRTGASGEREALRPEGSGPFRDLSSPYSPPPHGM